MAEPRMERTPAPVVAPTAKPIAQMSTEELANSVKEKVSLMLSSFKNSVTHAMDIGDLLIAAKDRVGHGNFEPWLQGHCQLSFSTARRYMKMAKNRAKIEGQLTIKSVTMTDLNAQKLLAPPTGDNGGGGNGGSGNGGAGASDKYDRAQDALIKRLEALGADAAEAAAEATIKELRKTVQTMKAGAKRSA